MYHVEQVEGNKLIQAINFVNIDKYTERNLWRIYRKFDEFSWTFMYFYLSDI